jgi:hypothetical protein
MGKIKIGSVNHLNIVKGDVNLLKQGEVLVSTSEGYTILRSRESNGRIKTFVVIPLEDFKNDKEVSTKTKSKDVDINPENIEGD